MCTAMTLQAPGGEIYFGRTMDFSYPLDPELYIVPKKYQWNSLLNARIQNQYSFMGIGQDISPVAFADGVNEMGFAAAVLYFPGCARYDPAVSQDSHRPSIAAIELVGLLLGLCSSVDQASAILRSIRITGVKDSVTGTVAPLHWIIGDKSGACMVVEKTDDGLHLLDNPLGVLSNSPEFSWHMTNLRGYMNVAPSQSEKAEWGPAALSPFGQGGGTFGLPGDYTPPSRFVRTAYLKTHTEIPSDRDGAVAACFHIMDSVTIPKGPVITSRETADYTQYTAFMNITQGEYYFKTYDNSGISAARLPVGRSLGTRLISLGKLNKPPVFEWIND